MKKLFVLLMAFVLMAGAAMAEMQLVNSVPLETSSVLFCEATNCYIVESKEGYVLYDMNGNALSKTYKAGMSAKRDGVYVEVHNVYNGTDVNCYGLLDASGKEILPTQYGDIVYLSDRWVLAQVYVPTTDEVAEINFTNGDKYNVGHTDVLYNGQIIGTLSRDYYTSLSYTGAHGDFMYVKPTNTTAYWIDSQFNINETVDDSYVNTSEYDFYSSKGVLHNATQQRAFVPGCTLTPDQVDQSVWYDSAKKQLLDLQGNVLLSNLNYYSVYIRGDYLVVKDNLGLYGVMDMQGNMIVQPKYKDISYTDNGLFDSGYNAATDADGNLYFFDKNGNETASAAFGLSSTYDYKGYNYNSPIVAVKNLGQIVIVTATHGQLPETYDDVYSIYRACKVVAVKKGDVWGVIDMAGNTVVPFELRSYPYISEDGTLVLGQGQNRKYTVYHLADTAEKAADSMPVTVQTSGAEENTEPALAEGAWQCTCGTITDGKFCPECGGKKPEPTPTPAPAPADDGSWDCTCGSHNTGKFCPECGSPKPAEPTPAPDPQCANCGYKPEGETPKFCPECGTKF